jgi:hypothetical protein
MAPTGRAIAVKNHVHGVGMEQHLKSIACLYSLYDDGNTQILIRWP